MDIDKIEIFDGEVMIRRDDPLRETANGIVLPDSAAKDLFSGTVVVAAKTMKDGSPGRFKPGDRVLFRRHQVGSFCNVEVDGETLMLIPSNWVWARVG